MRTERLLLRKASPLDLDDFMEMRNSEFVMKYNCMKPYTREQAMEQIEKDMQSEDAYYMELNTTGKVIGAIYLEPDSLRYQIDSLCISYYLREDCAKMGYMSEALREIIRSVFEVRGAEVLAVRVFSDNVASRRLVEKLGFINEGCLRSCVKGYGDIIHDDMVYSIQKDEYFESKAK